MSTAQAIDAAFEKRRRIRLAKSQNNALSRARARRAGRTRTGRAKSPPSKTPTDDDAAATEGTGSEGGTEAEAEAVDAFEASMPDLSSFLQGAAGDGDDSGEADAAAPPLEERRLHESMPAASEVQVIDFAFEERRRIRLAKSQNDFVGRARASRAGWARAGRARPGRVDSPPSTTPADDDAAVTKGEGSESDAQAETMDAFQASIPCLSLFLQGAAKGQKGDGNSEREEEDDRGQKENGNAGREGEDGGGQEAEDDRGQKEYVDDEREGEHEGGPEEEDDGECEGGGDGRREGDGDGGQKGDGNGVREGECDGGREGAADPAAPPPEERCVHTSTSATSAAQTIDAAFEERRRLWLAKTQNGFIGRARAKRVGRGTEPPPPSTAPVTDERGGEGAVSAEERLQRRLEAAYGEKPTLPDAAVDEKGGAPAASAVPASAPVELAEERLRLRQRMMAATRRASISMPGMPAAEELAEDPWRRNTLDGSDSRLSWGDPAEAVAEDLQGHEWKGTKKNDVVGTAQVKREVRVPSVSFDDIFGELQRFREENGGLSIPVSHPSFARVMGKFSAIWRDALSISKRGGGAETDSYPFLRKRGGGTDVAKEDGGGTGHEDSDRYLEFLRVLEEGGAGPKDSDRYLEFLGVLEGGDDFPPGQGEGGEKPSERDAAAPGPSRFRTIRESVLTRAGGIIAEWKTAKKTESELTKAEGVIAEWVTARMAGDRHAQKDPAREPPRGRAGGEGGDERAPRTKVGWGRDGAAAKGDQRFFPQMGEGRHRTARLKREATMARLLEESIEERALRRGNH